jgi:putative oxidoreductase
MSATSSRTDIPGLALSLLRFVAGLAFLQHGLAKLIGFPPVPALIHTAHLPPLALATGWIETVGGALVTLGLFTRPAAFLMSGEMAIAYFKVFAPKSFFPILSGGELALLFCFVFFYLAVAGGGPVGLGRAFCGARGRSLS